MVAETCMSTGGSRQVAWSGAAQGLGPWTEQQRLRFSNRNGTDLGVSDNASWRPKPLRQRHLIMSLSKHTDEVVETARKVGEAVGLPAGLQESLLDGARWHDAGKAHDVFQNSVRCGDPNAPVGILAKGPHRLRHSRPGFRHELA
jgi:hypothetical protein